MRIREYRVVECKIGQGAFSGERIATVELPGREGPLMIPVGVGYCWSRSGEHKPVPLQGQPIPGLVAVRFWREKGDALLPSGDVLVEFPDEEWREVDVEALRPVPPGDWSGYLI